MGAGPLKGNKFEEILQLIESGKSLRASCKELKISTRTFYEWIDEDEELQKQYARACNERQDHLFEEILEISDDGRNDTYTDDEGRERTDHDVIARSRLRVDARKWALAKMNPKKYGDKLDINQKTDLRTNVADLFPDELKDGEG